MVRVRFAPSPTGYLHIGGARTALYNWLYARSTGGVFVLRIEDTDAERSTRESYQAILDALHWLGLDWDEGPERGGSYGPYLQSARLVLYHNEAQRLLSQGLVYQCFCTKQELGEMRKEAEEEGRSTKYDRRCLNLPPDEVARRLQRGMPHVVRFRVPEGETRFRDMIRGELVFANSELDDFVILKSDGRPTYNFAVVVDDAKMEISHVIRGDDHIPNTPKQVLLYRALDYRLPKFAHLPMILGPDKNRLSKRHGATSVQEYRRMGILSDALVNYLALLGWSYDGRTEFFTRENLIKKFSLKRVSRNPAAFDPAKLAFINGEHFKRMDPVKKAKLVYSHLTRKGLIPPDFRPEEWHKAKEGNGMEDPDRYFRLELPRLSTILKVVGNRLKNPTEAPSVLGYFYKDGYRRDEEAYKQHLGDPSVARRLSELASTIEAMKRFDRAGIEQAVRGLAEKMGVGAAALIHPCRVALTGRSVSPDLFSVIYLLGRRKTVERLRAAAEEIAARR